MAQPSLATAGKRSLICGRLTSKHPRLIYEARAMGPETASVPEQNHLLFVVDTPSHIPTHLDTRRPLRAN
jgi:hypothetical protein